MDLKVNHTVLSAAPLRPFGKNTLTLLVRSTFFPRHVDALTSIWPPTSPPARSHALPHDRSTALAPRPLEATVFLAAPLSIDCYSACRQVCAGWLLCKRAPSQLFMVHLLSHSRAQWLHNSSQFIYTLGSPLSVASIMKTISIVALLAQALIVGGMWCNTAGAGLREGLNCHKEAKYTFCCTEIPGGDTPVPRRCQPTINGTTDMIVYDKCDQGYVYCCDA